MSGESGHFPLLLFATPSAWIASMFMRFWCCKCVRHAHAKRLVLSPFGSHSLSMCAGEPTRSRLQSTGTVLERPDPSTSTVLDSLVRTILSQAGPRNGWLNLGECTAGRRLPSSGAEHDRHEQQPCLPGAQAQVSKMGAGAGGRQRRGMRVWCPDAHLFVAHRPSFRQVMEAIRSGGLAAIKTARIKEILQASGAKHRLPSIASPCSSLPQCGPAKGSCGPRLCPPPAPTRRR